MVRSSCTKKNWLMHPEGIADYFEVVRVLVPPLQWPSLRKIFLSTHKLFSNTNAIWNKGNDIFSCKINGNLKFKYSSYQVHLNFFALELGRVVVTSVMQIYNNLVNVLFTYFILLQSFLSCSAIHRVSLNLDGKMSVNKERPKWP